MRKVWKPTNTLRFHVMGDRMMLIEFGNNNDKDRVAHDGPWHFDKCLIIVKEFDGVSQVKNICMKNATF